MCWGGGGGGGGGRRKKEGIGGRVGIEERQRMVKWVYFCVTIILFQRKNYKLWYFVHTIFILIKHGKGRQSLRYEIPRILISVVIFDHS